MKPREPTLRLRRYGVIDAYTLEELQREYQNSDAKGRIRLLENLSEDNLVPPYEIALLAVEDQNVGVRQWIARHGELDCREGHWKKGERVYKHPDRNLVDRLQNDLDPFVRASLRENEEVYPSAEAFQQANHLERLALVRNPHVSNDLIEKIFDPGYKELGLDLEQRKELVLAYLTNSQNLDRQRERIKDEEPPFTTSEHLTDLWRLISKWPVDVLEDNIYKAYRALPNPYDFEDSVLINPDGSRSRLRWLLEQGLKDPNDQLRYLTHTKVSYLGPIEIKTILAGNDPYALDGLYHNRSLYLASELYKKLVPYGQHWPLSWYSINSGHARTLGAGNWYSEYNNTTRRDELVKVLYDGVTYESLHPDIKEHLEIVGIFTDLRNHIELVLQELSKTDSFPIRILSSLESRGDLAGVDREIKKLPPANRLELFDGWPSEGNYLEAKIDFIGNRFLSYEEKFSATVRELRHTLWTAIILVLIYFGWKLLVWLLG